MTKKFVTGLAAGILCLGLSTFAQANLIVNGGFEDNTGLGTNLPRWDVYNSIPGWTTIDGPGIEIQRNGVAGSPYDGTQLVELDSHNATDTNSTMQQEIDTVLGQSYTLSFAYSPRRNVAEASNWINVLWNNDLVAAITGIGQSTTVWSLMQYTVVGTGAADALAFQATGTDDTLGGFLDAVSLTASPNPSPNPVPEPATMFLLGTGLIGLAGVGARRRNS